MKDILSDDPNLSVMHDKRKMLFSHKSGFGCALANMKVMSPVQPSSKTTVRKGLGHLIKNSEEILID